MPNDRPRGPDFLIVGGERCATTWLANNLRASEGVWIPPIKELHYFNRQIAGWRDRRMRKRVLQHLGKRAKTAAARIRRGRSPGIGLWDLRYFAPRRHDHWYAGLFAAAQKQGMLAGEATPGYALLDESMLERIRHMNPEVRLIFVMRDPVERAWSAVNKNNKRTPQHARPTLAQNIERATGGDVVEYSSYAATVERLDRVFREDQIFYGFYEEVIADPQSFMARVLRHIGIEEPDTDHVDAQASNTSGAGRRAPEAFREAVAPILVDDLERLCARFGEPPCEWLEVARQHAR